MKMEEQLLSLTKKNVKKKLKSCYLLFLSQMSEGTSDPYKQCILQLFKQDSLLVFAESFIHFRYLLSFTSRALLPLNAAAASFPSMFLWVWAAQISACQVCIARPFLSVQAAPGPVPLSRGAVCGPAGANSPEPGGKARPRPGSRTAWPATLRAGQLPFV